jgi:hypothetical protein
MSSSSSFAPSLGNLNALMASLNQSAGNSIYNFTNNPTTHSWNTMNELIVPWISTNEFSATGLRVLVALADGTVCYDSSKGSENTYSNFQSKSINENHNSRVAILQALLSNTGIGFEAKLSTTTNTLTNYLAQRIWYTNGRPMGTIRVSVDV